VVENNKMESTSGRVVTLRKKIINNIKPQDATLNHLSCRRL